MSIHQHTTLYRINTQIINHYDTYDNYLLTLWLVKFNTIIITVHDLKIILYAVQ